MSDIALLVLTNALALFLLLVLLRPSSAEKAVRRRLEAAKQRHVKGIVIERELRRLIAARSATQNTNFNRLIPNPALLESRLSRAGLKISLNQYAAICGGLVLILATGLLAAGAPFHIALLGSVPDGLFLPHLVVGFLIKRRINKFIVRFPDAIELMVRGLRSSLPIGQSMDVVARDFTGPIGEEFRNISDLIKIGQTMDKALTAAGERIAMAEFQFFCIAIAIQRETGGNLAETLANLAEVLRKRGQMKLKIKAMSSEAKASAIIIGVLPFLVFLGIYTTTPEYMSAFFTDTRLMVLGAGSLVWLAIGAFVMAKMSSFEI